MNERDALIEWFHALSSHSSSELENLASLENIELLRIHIDRSIPEYSLPSEFEPSEFSEAVASFRQSESSWNRATQLAIVKADDLFKAGHADEAARSLRAFAASCPWLVFKEAALNQADYFR